MLTCNFLFNFYFYSPLKSCNFNYSNLLLLINNSFGIRHCNHQPCSHINLLKLINYIKGKCLHEVIFFFYSIGYLNQSVHSPHFCWGVEPSAKFSEKGGLTGSQFLVGVARKEQGDFFRGVPVLT